MGELATTSSKNTSPTPAGRAAAWLVDAAYLFRDAGIRWSDDNCLRLGAALSYYAVFSVFPLLLLAVTVIGFLLGHSPETRLRLLDGVSNATTPAFRTLFDSTLEGMQEHQTARGVGAIIGLVTLIFGSSAVFSELYATINLIWRVPPRVSESFWHAIKGVMHRKMLSFVVVLGAAVALIGSVIITTVLTAIANRVEEVATGFVSQTLFWMVVENFGSITVLTLMLAAMFRLLPETRVEWRDVFVGAFVTSVLFTAIKHAVGWYLGHLASYAAYGAIGGFLALLTWIYLASLFLFYGAELTRVYAERFGSLATATPSGAQSPAQAPP